jgi:uncharacterized protein YdcH (DUF465 family)
MNPVFYRLTAIHRRLEDEIARELAHRAPNGLKLLRLKKLKLAVKDRLHGHFPKMRRA